MTGFSAKFIFLTLILFLFKSTTIYCQDNNDAYYNELHGGSNTNTIITAVPFLMIAPDARSGAMGDAGVSTSPDVNSMHWNPAKFAFIEKEVGFSMNYTPWMRSLIDDINLSHLSGFMKIDEMQTVAASLTYFTLGDIMFMDEAGTERGNVRPNEFSVDVAYSRKLGENISGAIAARYITSDLTQGQVENTKPGRAFATDVSVFYQNNLDWDTPTLFAFGMNISNIGNKISYTDDMSANFLPINLRLGPSFTFDIDEFNSIAFTLDFNKLLVPTPPIYDGNEIIKGEDPDRSVASGIFGSFTDAPRGFEEELEEISYASGIEYWYDEQFAIRGGYFHEHENKGGRQFFTLGLGLKYNVFGIDFSYIIPLAQQSPLQDVLRFSLQFDFGALRAQQVKQQTNLNNQ